MSVAVNTSDTAPPRPLRALDPPDVDGSDISIQMASPNAARRDTEPANPRIAAVGSGVAENRS